MKPKKPKQLDLFELHDEIMALIRQTDFKNPYEILGVLERAKIEFFNWCQEVEKEWEEEDVIDEEDDELIESEHPSVIPRPSVSSKGNDVMFR